MNLKHRPFLISLSVTFLIGYALSDISHFLFSNFRYYEEYNRERSLQLINYAKLGVLLLKHDETKDLKSRLDEAIQFHYFDFYILRDGDQTLGYSNSGGSRQAIDVEYVPNRMVKTDRLTYLSIKNGNYTLTLGLNYRPGAYLSYIWQENRSKLLIDILIVVFMAAAIAFYFFRDIRSLVNGLRRLGKKEFTPASSLEAKVMLSGLQTYESDLGRLRAKEKQLRRQVSGSIRTELDSGLTPPYDFRCVMVRTDINQYSTIYATFPVSEFMEVINEFFTRSSQTIEQYGGYVTEFVGDEIIYYFKEEDHENAAAVAVAAIRDINGIAASLHERTVRQNGYPFRVKSSLACGSLHFGQQVDRLALSGGVFVETVRILSEIEEKEENSIYLPARLASRLEPVAATAEKKIVRLRGIPGETRLYRVSGLRSLEEVLSGATIKNSGRLAYFREEKDICRVLEWASGTKAPSPVVLAYINALRHFVSPRESRNIRAAYESFLAGTETADAKLKGTAIALAARLFTPNLYNPFLKEAFQRGLQAADPRVVANAVEAFIHFDPGNRELMLMDLCRHQNNRVLANALLKLGMVELSREVVRELGEMLQSKDPLWQASGCFALGELAHYYQIHDPIFYGTSIDLKRLIKLASGLRDSSNEMVSRQATRALAKAGIAALERAA